MIACRHRRILVIEVIFAHKVSDILPFGKVVGKNEEFRRDESDMLSLTVKTRTTHPPQAVPLLSQEKAWRDDVGIVPYGLE